MNKKILIVGLGNPGNLYKNTRHNIGQEFVNWLKDKYHASDWYKDNKLLAQISTFENEQAQIILALPTTFMNESGKALKKLKQYYQIPLDNLIIIHDDNDIYLGNFKLSFGRGAAGHKGVESIINYLKTNKFYRLRIGIQPQNTPRQKAENLVLKKFSLKEKEMITNSFENMKKALEDIIQRVL